VHLNGNEVNNIEYIIGQM